MKTVVLGSGGWGTALSLVLHRNGHPVTLWSHVPEKAAYMERARENPRLEGVPLPPELRLTADMVCLTEAELVVVAVPSYAVRETAHAAAPLLRPGTLLVTAAKGIERDTHLRMSQILEQETGGAFPIAALSGPSHAEEVGRGLPTGCVAASVSQAAALTVQDAFMNDRFRVYTSPDIVGVELSGALKNVVALACGICDGMGYQDNTKALLMTRAMVELCHLGERLGGDRQTFGGLAGMGDLIVTCTSMHSRNRRAGILLGQGKPVEQTLAETGGVVEGYYAAASMHQLAEKTGVEMPICRCVYEILYRQRPVQEVARELMGRARKGEIEDFSVETATGETRARQLVEQTAPGLLLVDVQLAEGSGFGVCAYARSRGLPVIFLTASGDESSVVLGLDMGADDYIAKPFQPRELVSRIRSVLRRYGKEKTLVPLGGVMVDTEKGRVTRDGRDVYLSALEYRLLLVFLSHRGKVLSRSQLLEEIWDAAGDFVNDNTLTVYIKRLREKIETDPADPQIIRTVRGIGYMVDA